MSKVKVIDDGKIVQIMCPACKVLHNITIHNRTHGPTWTWNGSEDKPTFMPAYITITKLDQKEEKKPLALRKVFDRKPEIVCHSMIMDGIMHFYKTSTHALKGQDVPLPEIE